MHIAKQAPMLRGWLPLKLLWLNYLVPLSLGADEIQKKVLSADNSTQPLSAGYLIQFSVGLILVLTAVVVLAWVLRRINRLHASAGGALRLLGALSLGTRERVILIQVGNAQLLLGVAPGRIQTLHVMNDALSGVGEDPEQSQQSTFPRLFNIALKKRDVAKEVSLS